jgi:hypothetical protein
VTQYGPDGRKFNSCPGIFLPSACPYLARAAVSLTSVCRPSEVNSRGLATSSWRCHEHRLQRTLIGIGPVCVSDTDLDDRRIIIFLISYGGVRLGPLGTSATLCPIVPAPDDRC